MSVRLLPVRSSRKYLARVLFQFDAFATNSGLVHDVTDTDWGRHNDCRLPTVVFSRLSNVHFNKQDDQKSNGKKDETRMTAKILKQDPNIQKVKTNAVYDDL